MSLIRQLVASRMPQHVRMYREQKLSGSPRSLDHSQEPSRGNGRLRLSHKHVRARPCNGRRARSSGPRNGWTLSIPPLARFTCSRPCLRSICDQRSWQSSAARNPCTPILREKSEFLTIVGNISPIHPFCPHALTPSTARSGESPMTRAEEYRHLADLVRDRASKTDDPNLAGQW